MIDRILEFHCCFFINIFAGILNSVKRIYSIFSGPSGGILDFVKSDMKNVDLKEKKYMVCN